MKVLVQGEKISVIIIVSKKARTLARITVIATSVIVIAIAMDLARNASVTGKVHEVVLTIVIVRMMLI